MNTTATRITPTFLLAMFIALLGGGCLGQKFKVDAVARPDALEHISYTVREGTTGTQVSSKTPAAENCVRTALSAKGMYEAPQGVTPDLDVIYTYDIKKQRREYEIYSPTGPATGGMGGGGEYYRGVDITYEKTLHIIATEKNVATGARPRVWDIAIVTEDSEPLLQKTMPLLAAAGCDRIGTNTDGPITIRLREKDEAVAFIKRGL